MNSMLARLRIGIVLALSFLVTAFLSGAGAFVGHGPAEQVSPEPGMLTVDACLARLSAGAQVRDLEVRKQKDVFLNNGHAKAQLSYVSTSSAEERSSEETPSELKTRGQRGTDAFGHAKEALDTATQPKDDAALCALAVLPP
jgi:hypothetical protein